MNHISRNNDVTYGFSKAPPTGGTPTSLSTFAPTLLPTISELRQSAS
jgi:hypothetical protein